MRPLVLATEGLSFSCVPGELKMNVQIKGLLTPQTRITSSMALALIVATVVLYMSIRFQRGYWDVSSRIESFAFVLCHVISPGISPARLSFQITGDFLVHRLGCMLMYFVVDLERSVKIRCTS